MALLFLRCKHCVVVVIKWCSIQGMELLGSFPSTFDEVGAIIIVILISEKAEKTFYMTHLY